MKKYFYLLCTAIVCGLISCSDDDCDHIVTNSSTQGNSDVQGNWYEEYENEEMRINNNGTFYDRYSNVELCGETEGKWEYNSQTKKMTQTYTYLGTIMFTDWTVKNLSQFAMTISSDKVADHNLERIIESYDMIVGGTQQIKYKSDYPNSTVYAYSSTNARIASVSEDGLITAEGEKGTAYVKINTDAGNVWARVTVGDDRTELWGDYLGLMGMTYSEMRTALSRLGNPYTGESGYAFGYNLTYQSVVETLGVFLDQSTLQVSEIHLYLKEEVPTVDITAYLTSRYYPMAVEGYYSTSPDPETSLALVYYNPDSHVLYYVDMQSFLHPAVVDLWTDFTSQFGASKTEVSSAMKNLNYSFYLSDGSYSANGSDYYSITDNDYAYLVGFVFNPDDKVSEYWVYVNPDSDASEIYDYLGQKYNEAEDEGETGTIVFYNDDKTLKVVFDLRNIAVIYTDLTMKPFEAPAALWPNYFEMLGQSQNQIQTTYGTPYTTSETTMYYFVSSSTVSIVAFELSSTSNLCKDVMLVLGDNVETSTVVDYLNSKYTVYARGTAEDGSQYAWTDASTVSASTMAIFYYPENQMVIYMSLTTKAEISRPNIGNFNQEVKLIKRNHRPELKQY
jgi:uncharacterized lipoprotein YehR (DUF1307 family)